MVENAGLGQPGFTSAAFFGRGSDKDKVAIE